MSVYSDYQVYGPYYRPDGRQHVILIHHDVTGKIDVRRTISYPKYLVESYLGRYLNSDETVDHIDGNFSNNELSNLRVVPRSQHCKSHTTCRMEVTKVCKICGKSFRTINNWRVTCGSKACVGRCAHVEGYNIGNSFARGANILISNRSLIEEIQSVEGANSGKLLVGNPEQAGDTSVCVETLHTPPKSF